MSTVSRRTRCLEVGLALAASALLAAQAYAQDAVPSAAPAPRSKADTPPPVDEVIVRGRRMSEIEADLRVYIQQFIGKIAAPAPGRGYARWHDSVCVSVTNLANDAAHYIVDRISALALDVGLRPGEPGCAPQVVVIFASDAKQLATFLVKKHPRAFLPGMGLGGMGLGRDKLREFAESDKPVRWWHVSMPMDAHAGGRAVRLAEDTGPPTITVEGPSRIHSGTRDDLQRVFIIVDPTKLHGTTWQQLADYLAVVSLAQVQPDTNLAAFDTILNLFANPSAYSGLTDWDRSYVRALYTYDQERMPHMQKSELASVMAAQEHDRGE